MRTTDATAHWTQDDLDLRKHRQRRLVESLLERAESLPGIERALIEAVYRDGRSLADIARQGIVPGVTDAPIHPRTLGRRVRKLVTRLTDPVFQYTAWRLRQPVTRRDTWSPLRRTIAERGILAEHTQRSIAHELCLTIHTVRKHLHAIEVEAKAVQDAPAARAHETAAHSTGRTATPSATGARR